MVKLADTSDFVHATSLVLWYCSCRQFKSTVKIEYADMVELADTLDLGSNAVWCAGSSPVIRTISRVWVRQKNPRKRCVCEDFFNSKISTWWFGSFAPQLCFSTVSAELMLLVSICFIKQIVVTSRRPGLGKTTYRAMLFIATERLFILLNKTTCRIGVPG